MKILVLSPIYPIPTDNGAKRRILGFLEYFGPRHEVILAALDGKSGEDAQDFPWKSLVIPGDSSKISVILRSFLSQYTYREVKFWEPALQRVIFQLLDEDEFDLVWVNFMNMTRYLDGFQSGVGRKPLLILDQHNVDSGFWETFHSHSANPFIKLFAASEERKAIRRQHSCYPEYDVICSVSEDDRDTTLEFLQGDGSNIWLVPNGIDSNYFAPPPAGIKQGKDYKIIFTGSMDAYMNQQAACWFVDFVWPIVRQRFSAASFYVIGRNPTQKVLSLGDVQGVHVTGSVPDVRTWMKDADLAVIPLHLGGGTKLKTLEAMGMGLPIVSTPAGVQGLPITSGEQLLIAENPEGFGAGVCSLLEDRQLAQRLGSNARKLVEASFSWERIYSQVEGKLSKKLQSREDNEAAPESDHG